MARLDTKESIQDIQRKINRVIKKQEKKGFSKIMAGTAHNIKINQKSS